MPITNPKLNSHYFLVILVCLYCYTCAFSVFAIVRKPFTGTLQCNRHKTAI